MKLKKMKPHCIGLSQAILAALYCSLVANFIWQMEHYIKPQPEILVGMIMLFLLVFSAALTGTLVLGYPVYLLIHHDTKRAWQIVGFTLLYSLLLIILAITLISIWQ